MKVKVLYRGNIWFDILGIGGIGRVVMNIVVVVCKEKNIVLIYRIFGGFCVL